MAVAVHLGPLSEERDVRRVVALEADAFPPEETVSEETVRLRLSAAGPFLAAARDATGKLVGFVSGTLSAAKSLTEDSVGSHDPNGSTLCIRSVVVDRGLRRQGIALKMLKHFVDGVVDEQHQVKRIALFADPHLIELFVKANFAVTGVSPALRVQLDFDCETARRIPIVQVDAFTHQPFQGNPAAVLLLRPGAFHSESASVWMQQVAREKNLGATAFTAPRRGSDNASIVEYDIKWFSPVVELTMCGHGTLSTTVALLDGGHVLLTQTVRFYNRNNVLVCRYEATTNQQYRVVMDFPSKSLSPLPAGTSVDEIASALGIPRTGVMDAQLALNDVIVRLDKAAFAALKPNHRQLAEIATGRFVVTTEAPPGHPADFQSRFFAPRIGINEDPVTGSAHCGLGPYWSAILGKRNLVGYQSTSVRGGFVGIDLDEVESGRVLLKCQGVVVSHGTLTASS